LSKRERGGDKKNTQWDEREKGRRKHAEERFAFFLLAFVSERA